MLQMSSNRPPNKPMQSETAEPQFSRNNGRSDRFAETRRDRTVSKAPVTCYKCKQEGHMSKFCIQWPKAGVEGEKGPQASFEWRTPRRQTETGYECVHLRRI
jgi:hypothetical protein